jgi:hypothetical protein
MEWQHPFTSPYLRFEMKRFIALGALAVIGFYLYDAYSDRQREQAAREARQEHLVRVAEAKIQELVSQTGASDTWMDVLVEEKRPFSRIMTYELEDLWLNDRPILFIGYIDEIRSYNEVHYEVRVRRNWIDTQSYLDLDTILLLRADKERIKGFMSASDWEPNPFFSRNNVAIAAKLTEIDTESVADSNGVVSDVRFAKGNLVDIRFIGDVSL